MRAVAALAAILTVASSPLAAQSPPPRKPSFPAVILPADAEPPVIDGRLTEAVWQRAEALASFTQQDPQEGEPATERTEVRLLFTATHVYVGVICFDRDPSAIIRTQSRRDGSLTDTDSIIIVFDTFNDSQNAFVFGTDPLGIEYDGQVAREGQTSGVTIGGGTTLAQTVASGTQRGTISAFNLNWDADWVVKAQVTDRGWEAEMAIPLKTLRYAPGLDRTWGFNVLRNIRHKNEQVFLSPIPRGFDIYRISEAAKILGVSVPARRDVKLIPYGLASVAKDFTRASNQVDGKGTGGLDLKWGIRPSLTLDATVNTDFAQVEADEQQLNLTRFDLFFPEKRPFFLENASTFQFGQPQAVDLFFSRRIGLSSSFTPIDIIAGSRLSGKVSHGWDVGLLNIQTDRLDDADGVQVAPATNFSIMRAQKEMGRSTYGAIFVGKYVTDDHLADQHRWNRAYGVDADIQIARTQRISAFFARSDTPGATGSDYAGRALYTFTNNLWQISSGFSQVGDRFNPEVGFLPRRGYRRPEMRINYQYQPKSIPWIRRFSPHTSGAVFSGFDGTLQSSILHIHPFEIQPARGGRFGWFMDRNQDRPTTPFHGLRAGRPQGRHSTGLLHLVAERDRIPAQPQRARKFQRQAATWALLRRRLHLYRVHERVQAQHQPDDQRGVDAAARDPAGRGVRDLSVSREGELFVHAQGELVGAPAIQRTNGAVLLQHPARLAHPQRHGVVPGVQRPARFDRLHIVPDARAVVHREVHEADRFLIPVCREVTSCGLRGRSGASPDRVGHCGAPLSVLNPVATLRPACEHSATELSRLFVRRTQRDRDIDRLREATDEINSYGCGTRRDGSVHGVWTR